MTTDGVTVGDRAEHRRVDRRALIKGAAVVGGAVWAVPTVRASAMPVPHVSGLKPTQAGTVGVLWTRSSPWHCAALTSPTCTDSLPEGHDGCNLVHGPTTDEPLGAMELDICSSYEVVEAWACCNSGGRTPGTPSLTAGSVGFPGPACDGVFGVQRYQFSCARTGNGINHVELLLRHQQVT